MEAKMETISKVKKDVFEKTDKCMNELNKTKHALLEWIIRQFDRMTEGTQRLRNETNLFADRELSAIRANIELLSSSLENSEGYTDYEKMKNYHETVKEIIENIKENLSGVRSFQFPVFTVGRFSAEMLGRVTTGEITLVLPDHEHPRTRSPNPDPDRVTGTLLQQRKPVSSELKYTGTYKLLCCFIYYKKMRLSVIITQYVWLYVPLMLQTVLEKGFWERADSCIMESVYCAQGVLYVSEGYTLNLIFLILVTLTINTEMEISRTITFLGDHTTMISGHKAGNNKLKGYDLRTGAELSCIDLPPDAHGLAEVKLGEKLALAISHRLVMSVGLFFNVDTYLFCNLSILELSQIQIPM